jgi:hypothetical protein
MGSSCARRRVAPMESAEVARRKNADKQGAQAERKDVACRLRMESTDVRDQQIPNHRVEESPDNIDRCGGEPSAGRFGKGTLKGASHRAGDKVRDSVCRKDAPKEVRHKPKSIHVAELLFSSSEMISSVDPVSPQLANTNPARVRRSTQWVQSSTSRLSSSSAARSSSCS